MLGSHTHIHMQSEYRLPHTGLTSGSALSMLDVWYAWLEGSPAVQPCIFIQSTFSKRYAPSWRHRTTSHGEVERAKHCAQCHSAWAFRWTVSGSPKGFCVNAKTPCSCCLYLDSNVGVPQIGPKFWFFFLSIQAFWCILSSWHNFSILGWIRHNATYILLFVWFSYESY